MESFILNEERDRFSSSLRERELRNIEEFTMFDDTFFAAVFDGQLAATEVLIHTILNRDDITVIESKAQHFISNPSGHEVRLDVLAKDKKGNAYNFEVQRSRKGLSAKRARFYGAMSDTTLLRKGEDYESIPDRFTIFISETDPYGKMEPVYHIQNRVEENGNSPFGDGGYILYVNGQFRNLATPMGRLMHDFSCKKSSDIINTVLRERICYLKEAEGGQTSMCKIMDDTIKDVLKEDRLERDKETAKRMIAFGDSPSKISAVLDLPLSTVEQLAQSMAKA